MPSCPWRVSNAFSFAPRRNTVGIYCGIRVIQVKPLLQRRYFHPVAGRGQSSPLSISTSHLSWESHTA